MTFTDDDLAHLEAHGIPALPPPTTSGYADNENARIWYASFGEQILGKLDPRTGKITEYEIPILKANAPTGILGMRFDRDENPWLAMQFQGGIAKFDRKTEKFQTFSLPPGVNSDVAQQAMVMPARSAARSGRRCAAPRPRCSPGTPSSSSTPRACRAAPSPSRSCSAAPASRRAPSPRSSWAR